MWQQGSQVKGIAECRQQQAAITAGGCNDQSRESHSLMDSRQRAWVVVSVAASHSSTLWQIFSAGQ